METNVEYYREVPLKKHGLKYVYEEVVKRTAVEANGEEHGVALQV